MHIVNVNSVEKVRAANTYSLLTFVRTLLASSRSFVAIVVVVIRRVMLIHLPLRIIKKLIARDILGTF